MTHFDYLLNAFEAASQSDSPAKEGYSEKRRSLFAYVREIEELRLDAERYRWLIAHWDRIGVRVEYADGERHVVEINLLDPRKYPLNEESLVQAIDAARKGEETQ